jgi:hypothetical protein
MSKMLISYVTKPALELSEAPGESCPRDGGMASRWWIELDFH